MGWHVHCAIGPTAQPKLLLQLFTFFRFGPDKLQTPASADMEAHSLQAASTYVNNILLARGLLKSGHPIDFAQPDNGDGGSDATMARIINLVNDLVLRRDVSRCCSYRCRLLSNTFPARGRAPREFGDDDPDVACERVGADYGDCA